RCRPPDRGSSAVPRGGWHPSPVPYPARGRRRQLPAPTSRVSFSFQLSSLRGGAAVGPPGSATHPPLREIGWYRMGWPWHESIGGAGLVVAAVEGVRGPVEGCTRSQ